MTGYEDVLGTDENSHVPLFGHIVRTLLLIVEPRQEEWSNNP